MPFYQKGEIRIRYEEVGSGFPLLVTPGGGLNSRVRNVAHRRDQRDGGVQERFPRHHNGPAQRQWRRIDGPDPTGYLWDAFADDQLGLMDHLGIREFFFMGDRIGGCFPGSSCSERPGASSRRYSARPSATGRNSRRTCTIPARTSGRPN